MKRLLPLTLLAAAQLFAQGSRIELRSHPSAILGLQKNYNIFLPEGYDQDSLRYPVVYLFRGHEREWANPTEDGSRRGNIKTVADALYGRGAIGKMVLVMPGMSDGRTSAEYEYITKELIPHIDATVRTLPVRQKRGLDGFSYGGVDLLQLVRRNPELFFTAGSYDGSFWALNLTALFDSTTEAYWSLLRSMRFLLHSTPAGNWTSNQQFLSVLSSHGITNAFDTLDIAPNSAHNWAFADMHMERSLPLHWQHFQKGSKAVPLTWVSPLQGTMIAGTVPVRWSSASPGETGRTVVELSRDRGKSWAGIYSSTSHDTSFDWNTVHVADGTGFLFRVSLLGDTTYGFAQMAGRFTVNNPGNGVPEVGVVSPDSAQAIAGTGTVAWWAEDADGDPLTIAIDASPDNGRTWEHLADQPNTGSYSWNTPGSPNSPAYRVRVRASDAAATGTSVSGPFSLYNSRPSLQKSLVQHVSGNADGIVQVRAADPSKLTGHSYRVSFHDSLPGSKAYSVIDLDRSAIVVSRTPIPAPNTEGVLFDGLRLIFEDRDPPRLSKDSTRWISGGSNLIPDVSIPSFDPGTGMVTGLAYVADYRIRMYDHTVDTSAALFFWPPAPMNFTVRNITEDHAVRVLFTDLNGDGTISPYDDLIILEKDSLGGPVLTWELFFQGLAVPVPPAAGDLFMLKILKPFTRNDLYEFRALSVGWVAVSPTAAPVEFGLEQNYPNPFNGISNFAFRIPEAAVVRLQVFDLLGREVVTLVNEGMTPGAYVVRYDATGLASGMYIYRLTAGGMALTRKMLLMK
jgi:hypothetical protein